MATKENQARWRERKRLGVERHQCKICQKLLRKDSAGNTCRKCWLKTPEGKAYNIHKVQTSKKRNNAAALAKSIANSFSKELGYVRLPALEESEKKGCLELLPDIGFAHFHHRQNKQTTLYSLAVMKRKQKKGWGKLLLYRVLCAAIENGSNRVFLKCPQDLSSNQFYQSLGFQLVGVEEKARPLNCWQYDIKLPLLFFCNGGSKYDDIAAEENWRLGLQSTNRGRPQKAKRGALIQMIDNEWGSRYNHQLHFEAVKTHKPLIATIRDIEDVCQLSNVLKAAREFAPYCGRVVLIPKVKCWLPNEYWLGFSIPTSHGHCDIESEWFGDRFVHLLGGSPTQQMNYAEKLNVVSLDSKQAMLRGIAGTGKSIWQGNSGIKVAQGCYEAFRVSMVKQREFWWGNGRCTITR